MIVKALKSVSLCASEGIKSEIFEYGERSENKYKGIKLD